MEVAPEIWGYFYEEKSKDLVKIIDFNTLNALLCESQHNEELVLESVARQQLFISMTGAELVRTPDEVIRLFEQVKGNSIEPNKAAINYAENLHKLSCAIRFLNVLDRI